MAFLHDIDIDQSLARATFSGTVSEDEVRRCLSRIWSDPRWSPGFSILLDLRSAFRLMVSDGFFRSVCHVVAGRGSGSGEGGRTALVLDRDVPVPVPSQVSGEPSCPCRHFSVFSDWAEAQSWLKKSTGSPVV